ncbi:hypothetical protein ACQP25_23140 [Microtetraspora malaysiensis]|uniref:hypothetical protein n=1 Tax=Microtetraspora malaysiensis TaxID=161358 RepID=UPI003D927999
MAWLTRLVAGAFDPISGFRSAIGPTLRHLGLPADTDPYQLVKQGAAADPAQAAVIDAGDLGAFRANYEAFSHEPGPHAELAASGVTMLMYAGTADPWHDPMRTFAQRTGADFFSRARRRPPGRLEQIGRRALRRAAVPGQRP